MNIFGAYAQNKADTIYTKINNQIVNKNEAVYFEIIQALDSGLYKTKQYYVENNLLIRKGQYQSLNPNKRYGKFLYYYKTGILRAVSNFINDTLNGEYIDFDSLGNIKYIEQYKSNKLDGDCKYFYTNGNIKRVENYKDGQMSFGKCYKLNGEDTLYFRRNINPKFGIGTFQDFVNENFNDNKNINYENGTVEVGFTLLKDGSIDKESLRVLKGAELPILANEAIRLAKMQPNYIPAYEEGIPIKFSCSVKVSFENDNTSSNPRKEKRKQMRGR